MTAADEDDTRLAISGQGDYPRELKRENLSYADLAERLTAIGAKETPENVNNKIARGSFSAVFFLQCMEAIGVKRALYLNGDMIIES